MVKLKGKANYNHELSCGPDDVPRTVPSASHTPTPRPHPSSDAGIIITPISQIVRVRPKEVNSLAQDHPVNKR